MHRGAGAGPVVAAFHRGQVFHITHTDFIAVIDKRRTWHGEQKGKSNFHFIRIEFAGKSVHIVIAGRDAHQSSAVCFLQVFFIFGNKFACRAFARLGEVGLVTAKQRIVVGRTKMEQKVHMEAAGKGFVRLAPLGNHGGIRKLFVEKIPYILPQFDGSFAVLVVFDKGACHIHTEAVAAHLQPETHNIFQFGKRCLGAFVVHGLLPRAPGIIKSIV